MSTLLDEPTSQSVETTSASNRLRTTMAAARLSFNWLGVRKSLNSQQKNQAADSFGAEGKFLSAGKKLLDTSHPSYKAVTAIRGRAVSYWKGVSLPYPEPGVRLIRQDAITEFDGKIAEFRTELDDAVAELDRHFDELREAARQRLGDLFDASDYPASLIGMFAIEHDYPSVEPPDYLRQLSPELYQQECQRVQARFDEAVQLAEQAFLEELAKLVDHLAERLNGQDDGKPKVFRDSAVTNLTEFFERFRSLNVRSNDQLDALVERAQGVVNGVAAQDLRDSGVLRQQIASQLTSVQSSLDGLLVDRPRRNILRRPR
ncbi:hypothetical protein LOC68_18980 [Blastopirellula sp. JC732]|uniref:DUF3150 domain-containing protein n=1 Tax=Blastopirellula sediminis TaxID=2894196 RepID=A0A9X1MRW2_9BACT|nr:hypothetical protein [Blastopirellula sediminis]MCC9606218.1 hypothetical protein [Blastopirellula sediminis]MCC9630484.1 hypothetical protein [Blastopirellula sediminis]